MNLNQIFNLLITYFIRIMKTFGFNNYSPDDILVKIDRAAMASSIETRIPLLDHKLIKHVEFSAQR